MTARLGVLLALALWLIAGAPALAASVSSPLANWAVVVAAGDYRDHDGNPSDIFDNARRDVSAGLIADGFAKANLFQYSVLPSLHPDTSPRQTDPTLIAQDLRGLAQTANGGCLYYYTSHGAYHQGAVYAADQDYALDPALLAKVLDIDCGDRPTVVVISACFSGYYVPFLHADNRMILTAASSERPSFGCGATDKYPYFDDCMVSTLPTASDFIDLGKRVDACIDAKEKAMGITEDNPVSKPSQPQMDVGSQAAKILPTLRFSHAGG